METSNKTSNKIKRKGKTQKKINGLSIQSLRNKRVINRYMKYTKKFRPNSLLYTISEHNSNDSNDSNDSTKTFHPKVSQINDKLSFSKKKDKDSMLTLLKKKIKNKTYKTYKNKTSDSFRINPIHH